jgi:hypothetical protein
MTTNIVSDQSNWECDALKENLIKHFSLPCELVVNICEGGFTRAVTCKRLGRHCISCGIDEGGY